MAMNSFRSFQPASDASDASSDVDLSNDLETCSFVSGDEVALYSGDVGAAFEELGVESRECEFTPMDKFVGDMVLVGEALISSAPTPTQLFATMYGKSSGFMARYQSRRKASKVQWDRPSPSQQTPFGAFAKMTCQIPLPVLGLKPFKEFLRMAVCEWEGKPALVVQSCGIIHGGALAGTIRTETVYLFVEGDGDGTIFRAMLKTPPGFMGGKAIDGAKVAFDDFHKSLLHELQTNSFWCNMRVSHAPSNAEAEELENASLLSGNADGESVHHLNSHSRCGGCLDGCVDGFLAVLKTYGT